jgi:hypothetical protein
LAKRETISAAQLEPISQLLQKVAIREKLAVRADWLFLIQDNRNNGDSIASAIVRDFAHFVRR